MDNLLDLKSVLKSSYKTKEEADKYFESKGYFRDKEISNIQQRLYNNPETNKNIAVIRGTHNLINDIPADIDLLFGLNYFGNRLNESKQFYEKIKNKYKENDLTIVGHSLGGFLSSEISKNKNDKIISYNKGSGIFEPFKEEKKNEKHYRTINDIISLTSAFKSNTKNLNNYDINLFNTHSTNQLKSNIFI